MAAEKVKPPHTIARVTKGSMEYLNDQLNVVARLHYEDVDIQYRDIYKNGENINRNDYDGRKNLSLIKAFVEKEKQSIAGQRKASTLNLNSTANLVTN